jgi:flagellar biogenesis protein FliO
MVGNTNPFDDEMEKQTTAGDATELPTHSRWDDFFLTLKLVAIALAILGAIWGITHFQSS